MERLKAVFLEIEEIGELPAFQEARAKDKSKNELTPQELLEDYPDSPRAEELRWMVMCEQLSDSNYLAFERLYYDKDVLEIYKLLAVRTAIYAARDDE